MNKASAFEMDALDSRIKELVAYARERDGEDRSNLFRNLIDLFLTGKAPKINPTRSQLLDVLQALIPHVEAENRRTACDLVANMSNPPSDLVLRLAQDRASLVSNLLTQISFEDDELIDLIEKTGREHHQVIASREDLSANIWIALARAAPSAPPFDHHSTLALWSDDLGITRTKAPEPEACDAPSPAPKAPAIGNPKKAAEQRARRGSQQSATVTPIHPKLGTNTGAAIRILRTDEDLIASRGMEPQPESAPQARDTGAEEKISATDTLREQDEKATTKAAADEQEDISFIRKSAQDPGPGGWSWISDRDGFITSISAQGHQILGESFTSIGTSMLDLLGLNTKLGHPVARAFQRRSGIHDAPIFLPSLDKKNHHWTLEATPYFSSCGGIFEGYEGILTPVVAVKDELDHLPADDEANALFLDDIAARPAASLRIMPSAFTDQATVFQAAEASPVSAFPEPADTVQPVEAMKPTQQALEAIASDLADPDDIMFMEQDDSMAEPQAASSSPSSRGGTADQLSKAAASVIKDVLAEALAPLSASTEATLAAARAKEAKEAEASGSKASGTDTFNSDALTSTDTSAHIAATLNLLEEALNCLALAGKASGDPQCRLQGEIASACVRSLKEQLK